MKTIKITEEAWEKLNLFKAITKQKTFSETIKTAVFYANVNLAPIRPVYLGSKKNDQSKK